MRPIGLFGGGPDLVAEIGLDARGFLIGTRQVETSLATLARHPFLTGAAIAGAIGGAGLAAAVGFESAMAGVAKTMNLTAEETAAVAAEIVALSKVKPFSPNEIAGVAEVAGQLGIGKEHLTEFVAVMLDMGAATNMTAAEAADAFARFAAAAGVPQDQFDEMASTVVDLGNNFAATEAEIVKMAFRIAGAGTTVGLSTNEILGLSAALSSMGVRAEMGGSALSRIIKNIHVAVNGTTEEAQDRLEVMAAVAGVTADDFARVWSTKPTAALTQFLQGLSDMEAAGTNLIPVLEEMGLTEIRVSDVLLRAKNGQDLVRRALDQAAVAWEENSALTKEAERRYETTASQLRLLGNDVTAVALAVGNAMLPAFREGIASLREFVQTGGGEGLRPVREAIGALKDTVTTRLGEISAAFTLAFGDAGGNPRALAVAFAGAIAAVTVAVDLLAVPLIPAAEALGAIAGYVTALPGGLEALAVALAGVTLAVWASSIAWAESALAMAGAIVVETALIATNYGLSAAFQFLFASMGPVGWVILGITAAIAAAILIWRNWDTVTAAVSASIEWLGNVVRAAWGSIVGFADFISGGLVAAWDATTAKAREAGAVIEAAWATVAGWLADTWANIVSGALAAWEGISEAFTAGSGRVLEAGRVWLSAVLAIPRAIFDGFTATLAALILALAAVFTGDFDRLLDIVTAWAAKLVDIGKTAFDTIAAPILAVTAAIADFAGPIFDNMVAGFRAGWDTVVAFLRGLPETIGDFLSDLPEDLERLGRRIINGLADGFEDAWDGIVDFFEDAWDDMGDFAEDILDDLEDFIDDILDDVADIAEDAWDNVRGFITSVPDKLASLWSNVTTKFQAIGVQIVNGLKMGIESAWTGFTNWLNEKWDGIIDWAESILGIQSPSTVFRGIGENVVAGFREGIEPLGDLLNGRVNANVTLAPQDRGNGRTVVVNIGTIHASGRRDGEQAFQAFERRLRALGVNG